MISKFAECARDRALDLAGALETIAVFRSEVIGSLCRRELGHLHILLNYEWDSRAILSLIPVGLPDLLDRLSLRRNRSLFSRMHKRLRVDPLTSADPGEHIRMRLARVGCDRKIFASSRRGQPLAGQNWRLPHRLLYPR